MGYSRTATPSRLSALLTVLAIINELPVAVARLLHDSKMQLSPSWSIEFTEKQPLPGS